MIRRLDLCYWLHYLAPLALIAVVALSGCAKDRNFISRFLPSHDKQHVVVSDEKHFYDAPVAILRTASTAAGVLGAIFVGVGIFTSRPGSVFNGAMLIAASFGGHAAATVIEAWFWWIVAAGIVTALVATYETWREWSLIRSLLARFNRMEIGG